MKRSSLHIFGLVNHHISCVWIRHKGTESRLFDNSVVSEVLARSATIYPTTVVRAAGVHGGGGGSPGGDGAVGIAPRRLRAANGVTSTGPVVRSTGVSHINSRARSADIPKEIPMLIVGQFELDLGLCSLWFPRLCQLFLSHCLRPNKFADVGRPSTAIRVRYPCGLYYLPNTGDTTSDPKSSGSGPYYSVTAGAFFSSTINTSWTDSSRGIDSGVAGNDLAYSTVIKKP
ncbi:hypothetical protein EDD21DRAFT_427854 [Dissophora ornata]|nr:hypothetical protein EDD21DRAFT_427854 [Dissophora ornata]